MIRVQPLLWSLVLMSAVSVPLAASGLMQLTVTLPADGCVWTGPLFVTGGGIQPGCNLDLTGAMALTRVAGASPACPPALSGAVSGTLSGLALNFGVASTEFGNMTFAGEVDTDGLSANGTWSGPAGTGAWSVESDLDFRTVSAELIVRQPADGCEWSGPVRATGGMVFTGSTALTRVAGNPPACPSTLGGALLGKYFGSLLCFDLSSNELGDLAFTGTVDVPNQSAGGTWSGDPVSGTWEGRIGRAVQNTPALSHIGLVALAGLLVAAGVLSVRRRAMRVTPNRSAF